MQPDVPQAPASPQAAVSAELPVFTPAEYCVGLTPPEFKWLPLPDVTDAGDADLSGADADISSLVDIGPDAVADREDAATAELPLPPLPSLDAQASAPADAHGDASSQEDLGADADSLLRPDATEEADGSQCDEAPVTCIGAAAPQWELFDFQPKSCGYQATYGLDQYTSHVTVVALLAAW